MTDSQDGKVVEAGTGQGNLHDDEQDAQEKPDAEPQGQAMAEDGGPKSAAQDDTEEDLFPVERPADLTQGHLPQQLIDEIKRPLRQHRRALGEALFDTLDTHNDRIQGLQAEIKQSQKDSERLNEKHLHTQPVQTALIEAGLIEAPQEVAAQEPGQEDA